MWVPKGKGSEAEGSYRKVAPTTQGSHEATGRMGGVPRTTEKPNSWGGGATPEWAPERRIWGRQLWLGARVGAAGTPGRPASRLTPAWVSGGRSAPCQHPQGRRGQKPWCLRPLSAFCLRHSKARSRTERWMGHGERTGRGGTERAIAGQGRPVDVGQDPPHTALLTELPRWATSLPGPAGRPGRRRVPPPGSACLCSAAAGGS